MKTTEGAFDVSTQVFEQAAELFGLMATPARLRILDALTQGELNVSELLARIGGAQPTMSQHLGQLYRAGLLARRREGAQVYYRVNAESVPLLCAAVRSMLPARA
jgi:ArsR family transcriptional regulator